MKKQLIPSIHSFRAFAILNIVAIHAFEFIFYLAGTFENAPQKGLTQLKWIDGILFHDSTLYFTFISGALFTLVLADRGYARFYTSKIKFVVLPYLLFTALFSLHQWSPVEGNTLFQGSISDYLALLIKNFFIGSATFTFWYIPVLFVLYIATPALNKLLEIEKAKGILILILLAPLFLSRTWPDFSWTTFVYFIGAYLLGMLVGRNYQKTIDIIEKHIYLLVVIAIVSTLVLYYLFYLEAPKWGIISLSESAWYIQKIAFSALLLFWLERTVRAVPKWVDLLANYAFSIYFLHGMLLVWQYSVLEKSGVVLDSEPIIVLFALLNFVMVILLSVTITYVVKLILGRWSRMVIGS